jgi:ABC-type multidrug transport system ATPase subunit
MLADLKREGLTVAVSTPYMDEANRCDRVALMQGGRLLGIDTPAAIVASFDRPLYAVRSADRYRALLALREFAGTDAVYPFGDVLHYVDARAGLAPPDVARDVAAYLEGRHLPAALVLTAPTVEDSFMARMKAVPPAAARAEGGT